MDRAGENTGLADLKANLWRLYEMVAIGIMDSRETTNEVKNLVDVVGYTSYQISNHDARIDDTEMNLKEIMRKVHRIQKDLQLLVQLNQGSQAHENPVISFQVFIIITFFRYFFVSFQGDHHQWVLVGCGINSTSNEISRSKFE